MLRYKKSDHFTNGHEFLLQKELYVCIKYFVKGLGTEDKAPRECILKRQRTVLFYINGHKLGDGRREEIWAGTEGAGQK